MEQVQSFWLSSLLLVLAGGFVLLRGAGTVVDQSVILAKQKGISEAIIGATLVALGTSLPEWGVSFFAAVGGHADLSFGNIMGSNLVNVGGVLSLALIVAPVRASISLLRWDAPFFLVSSVVLIMFVHMGGIGHWMGLGLLAAMIMYLFGAYGFARHNQLPDDLNLTQQFVWWKLILAFGALMIGSRALVEGATDLARGAGVPEWLVAVTLVSVGTSLPELATTLSSVGKGHVDLSIGNILGSNIWNTFFVLGSVGAVTPVAVDSSMAVDGWFLLIMTVVLCFVMWKKGHIVGRKTGLFLFVLYLACITRWANVAFG